MLIYQRRQWDTKEQLTTLESSSIALAFPEKWCVYAKNQSHVSIAQLDRTM